MKDLPYIQNNYQELMEELDAIADRVGVKTPTLVAVTKSGTDEELCELMRSGAVEIGENRPQELRRRADILYGLGYSPILHEIGTLQRNKVKLIIKDVKILYNTIDKAIETVRLSGIDVQTLRRENSKDTEIVIRIPKYA